VSVDDGSERWTETPALSLAPSTPMRGGEPCLLRSPPRNVPVDIDGMRDQKPIVPSHEPALRPLSDSACRFPGCWWRVSSGPSRETL
jgi:hypothetical protein